MKDKDSRQAGLDSLWYEINMFVGIFNKISTQAPLTDIERNSNLETFLLHARNLLDFLTNKGGEYKITANQFGDGIKPYTLEFPDPYNRNKTCSHKEFDSAINNYLSHLDWGRITGDKPKWEGVGIKKEITRNLMDFVSKLPSDSFPTKNGETRENFMALLS